MARRSELSFLIAYVRGTPTRQIEPPTLFDDSVIELCDHPMLFATSVWPLLHWSRARTDVADRNQSAAA